MKEKELKIYSRKPDFNQTEKYFEECKKEGIPIIYAVKNKTDSYIEYDLITIYSKTLEENQSLSIDTTDSHLQEEITDITNIYARDNPGCLSIINSDSGIIHVDIDDVTMVLKQVSSVIYKAIDSNKLIIRLKKLNFLSDNRYELIRTTIQTFNNG